MIVSALRRAAAGIVLAAAAAPAFAIPVTDMHVEDLVMMAPDFKQELKLDANQERLWSQVESKTRQLIRDRVSRRERLQAAFKAGLQGQNVELRDMVSALDAETATSAAEEKQLREWWLTLNDALNDGQRRQVASFLYEQLMRLPDAGASHSDHKSDDSANRSGRGGRRGMGGAGAGAGAGGAGVNVPIPGQ